jgi:hypothetical protein
LCHNIAGLEGKGAALRRSLLQHSLSKHRFPRFPLKKNMHEPHAFENVCIVGGMQGAERQGIQGIGGPHASYLEGQMSEGKLHSQGPGRLRVTSSCK